MKRAFVSMLVGCAIVLSTPCFSFAASEKETAFVEAYKKAFESKDEAALQAFLYTKGADPEILSFFSMMMTAEFGGKITSIELKDLSQDEVKRANEVQPLPSGENAKLPVSPTKKLVVKIESGDANGKSTSSSETFVAEVDGKLLIPVPGPIK